MCAGIARCASNNGGCSSHATCTNTHHGVNCACKPGFNGNGVACVHDKGEN